MKYKMAEIKKRIIIFVSILFALCICLSCYLFVYKPYAGEQNKINAFCDYLVQFNEEMFIYDIGMDSADALVNYNKELNQYSITLSLVSDEEVSEEQIASYKMILERQQFAEITLIVNGEVK